jgi:hypothetical protein
MARYIFYAIGIYLLYRLIFDIILPVRKTTKAMRSQFREAQERMNEAYRQQQQQSQPQPQPQQTAKQEQIGDYIDFEEVK